MNLLEFLGYGLDEGITDHTTVSWTRRLIDRQTHERVWRSVEEDMPVGVVLADAAYGSDTKFREALVGPGLEYVVGCSRG